MKIYGDRTTAIDTADAIVQGKPENKELEHGIFRRVAACCVFVAALFEDNFYAQVTNL